MVSSGKTVATAVGRPLLRLVAGREDLRHFVGEGFIDFTGDRYLVDHGSFAKLQVGTRAWSGRSGRPVNTLPVEPPRVASQLWLMQLLVGTSGATDEGIDEGVESVAGERWRRFTLSTNLAVASAACSAGMPSPPADRFESLLELPVEIWLDDGFVKQIRFVTESETTVLTLTEFGVNIDGIDWHTLPSFGAS